MSVHRGSSIIVGVVTLRAVRVAVVRAFVTATHTFVHSERATGPRPPATSSSRHA